MVLDDLGEKEINDQRVQALFKRVRQKISSILSISQDYYELPKRTLPANVNIYHIFKTNNFRDAQNLHRDKASTDMILNEFKHITNICCS